jgi:hypothetical protein
MTMLTEYALSQASLTRSRLPLGNYGWLKYGLNRCPTRSEDELRAIAATMTSGTVQEHPTLPAGYTYFGQLIDHDLSFQSATSAQRRNDPDYLYNFRTPAFDLDCLYGRGPQDQPYLYRRDDPSKLLTGRAEGLYDLPRNALEQALVGDPRNDEQLLVSHFHLALIEFHNQMVDVVTEESGVGGEIFERARTLVTWHYQWVVLHDYLPRILQPQVLERLLDAVRHDGCRPCRVLRHFAPAVGPYLPHEFVGAAFRFGHSLVRESYVLNAELDAERKGKPIPPFAMDGDDLRGGRKPPAGWWVDPELILDIGESKYQRSLRIDTHLSSALARVPVRGGSESLAYLDLRRGQDLGLPSGQALARAMGIRRILDASEAGPESDAARETPLWYYVLKEAEIEEKGLHLGELGSTIVGEVLVGLLLMDPSSFLSREPGWRPTLLQQGCFTLGDLIRFALLGQE